MSVLDDAAGAAMMAARWDFEDNDWREIARAVLMAVREPDERLEEVGAPWANNVLPGAAFTAMIDAILADGGE